MATVRFDNATRTYAKGQLPAVNELDLDIDDGELLVLVGPSGCGKSTTLRLLAGLEPLDDGAIVIGDRDVSDVPAKQRDVAMVFQSYALYPHMTVAENIGFHLKISRVPKTDRARRVQETAALLGLEDYLGRRPASLSGGQRQRVAMGRAIVREPQVFLMDEPLSNLDAKLRVQTRTQIAALQRRLGTTMVYVTHDQVEAMTMGDRVAVLDRGELQQCASPRELFAEPANVFVAGFIGSPPMNLLPGLLDSEGVSCEGLVLPFTDTQRLGASNQEVTVGIRPDGWTVTSPSESDALAVTVDAVEELGTESFVYSHSAGDRQVVARAEGMTTIEKGAHIGLRPDPQALHLFDTATGARLPA